VQKQSDVGDQQSCLQDSHSRAIHPRSCISDGQFSFTNLSGDPASCDQVQYWLARIAGAEERWACTPTVAWALERGQAVAISEAHVWTAHSRAMETWYERLRGARTALYADTTPAGRLALAVFKLTYAVTISSLAGQWHRPDSPLYRPDSPLYRPDSPLYRPDWRHAILAQGAANLSRALGRMDAAGCTPVAVNIDCVWTCPHDWGSCAYNVNRVPRG